MKLFEADYALKVINEHFENEKMDFDTAGKLCDLIVFLEAESEKYRRLMQKFVNEHYNKPDEDDQNQVWVIKDKSQEALDRVAKEKKELECIEMTYEKKMIKRIDKIAPKVLIVLREFFDFKEG